MAEQTPPQNPPAPVPHPGSEVSAPFVNQFYLTPLGEGNFRMTFGELLYGHTEAAWRAAVVCQETVTLQLAQVILRFYAQSHPEQGELTRLVADIGLIAQPKTPADG